MKLPKHFYSNAVACEIKQDSKKLDLAIIYSEDPCHAAALFTTNEVKAAPVILSQLHHSSHSSKIHAIILNSGNANAVTGNDGHYAAKQMAHLTAKSFNISPESCYVMSTGVIGVQLPIKKIENKFPELCEGILNRKNSYTNSDDCAVAMMTTDTKPKQVEFENKNFRMVGLAKGSGMIHPNMATMLGIVLTDAVIEQSRLQQVFTQVINETFHCISIDGDTSTNDTAVVLANGASGYTPTDDELYLALKHVCKELAIMIVRDAEGSTKLIDIKILGAHTYEDAFKAAHTIGGSLLVKTAMYGNDANWGRLLAALGRSKVTFSPEKVTVKLMGTTVLDKGTPVVFNEEEMLSSFKSNTVHIEIFLNIGSSCAQIWTCDLSHKYIDINASYRT